MNWYTTSILSLVFFALQYYVYKIAAEKKANSEIVTLAFMVTLALAGLVIFIFRGGHAEHLKLLLYLSLAAGLTFLFATFFRLESLKYIPSSVAFFVFDFKVLTIALVSLFYFNEPIKVLQAVGILTAIAAALLVIDKQQGEKEKYGKFNLGITSALIVVLALTLNSLAVKKSALIFDPLTFIFFEGVLSSIFAFGLYFYKRSEGKSINERPVLFSIGFGVLVGFLNFLAFYFEIVSLKNGSLAVVTAIISFSTIGAILLSALTYKERLGLKRAAGIVLGFVSLLLLK